MSRIPNAKGHLYMEEIRARLLTKRWDMAYADVTLRLSELHHLFENSPNYEMYRHIVVSAVAALQTYHRSTIIEIVNSGPEYEQRAVEQITARISISDALAWFRGKPLTFGEFAAHAASCNSLTDMISWLESLLDCQAKIKLAGVCDAYSQRTTENDQSPIIEDIDVLLSNLNDLFRLRHIFCHEAAYRFEVEEDDCRNMLNATSKWVEAVDALLWSTIRVNKPLTSEEMNEYASRELREARKSLAQAMRSALNHVRSNREFRWIVRNHFNWKRTNQEWAHSFCQTAEGSTSRIHNIMDLAETVRQRAQKIRGWNALWDLD